MTTPLRKGRTAEHGSGRYEMYPKYLSSQPDPEDFEYFPAGAKQRLREIFWNIHYETAKIAKIVSVFADEDLMRDYKELEMGIMKSLRTFNKKHNIGYL
jgi:hypothetical protein